MHQAAALARLNFKAADHCCCRRKERTPLRAKAFILTIGVEGQSLPALLAQDSGVHSISLFEKRSALKHLALKFDAYTNRVSSTAILYPRTSLSPDPLARKAFFFHGQRRTHQYPQWIPHTLWRRNLVQLNRIPLPE